jgi:hypothetical protein
MKNFTYTYNHLNFSVPFKRIPHKHTFKILLFMRYESEGFGINLFSVSSQMVLWIVIPKY